MPEQTSRRNPFVTQPATTARGSDVLAAVGPGFDLALAERIADLLADAGPLAGSKIARALGRQTQAVFDALRCDPRFVQCGSGRRWSKWCLADENVRTGARERSHDVGKAEVTSGLPPAVTGPQNVSQDADAEPAVSASASVRMRARARETDANGSGERRASFRQGVADMRLPTSPARGLTEAQEIAHLTGLPLSDESSRSTMPPWRRGRDG